MSFTSLLILRITVVVFKIVRQLLIISLKFYVNLKNIHANIKGLNIVNRWYTGPLLGCFQLQVTEHQPNLP